MPRIKMGFEEQPRKTDKKLVDRLVDELKANRESGQPFIYEQAFSTGKVRVLVIWDDWKDLTLEQRTSIIVSAIELSDGKDYRAKVALASKAEQVSSMSSAEVSSPLMLTEGK